MNLEELHEVLFHLSEKEKNYKKNNYSTNSSQTEQVQFYGFLPEFEGISGKEYSISKHIRFKPVTTHIHETCELNYIYSGECTQYINGKKFHLKEGDVVILDRNVPHSIEYVGYEDIIINIQMKKNFFTPGFLQDLLGNSLVGDTILGIISNKQNKNYMIFQSKNNLNIKECVQKKLIEFYSQKTSVNTMISAYMIIFFCELLRSVPFYIDMLTPSEEKSISVANILRYIEHNFVDGNLENTAKHFMYSPTHLSRILKENTGKTFKQLIFDQRMKQATFLLKSSQEPIYSIADQVGIKNLNYFYKKFKQQFGILPQEYRKTNKNY